MYELRILPPAAKYLKKIKDKNLKKLYKDAMDAICNDPSIGTEKTGDLSGVRGYDIFYNKTNYELAYTIKEENGKLVIIDMLKDIEFDFHYDINNYQDIDKALKELRYLCDKYNFSILYIHHLNKNGNSLGSTALDGSVDGIFTLSKVKDYDNRYTLKITNRDYPSKDISLIKDEKCILTICDDVLEEDIDYNLMLLIKYISNKGNIEFTCSEIVNKANLQLTPKQLGIRLKKWKDILLKEGINISYKKSAKQRLYSAYYEEKTEEENASASLYYLLKTYTDNCLKVIEDQGKVPVIKGFIWHQGESDSA